VPEEFWANALYSVTPTILVGLIFWFVIRGIIRADRTERKVYTEIEAEERAKFDAAAAASSHSASPSASAEAGTRDA
jgi:flagellar biosynthesis/type III secretory pathway M-ring protein FliF/YscJ